MGLQRTDGVPSHCTPNWLRPAASSYVAAGMTVTVVSRGVGRRLGRAAAWWRWDRLVTVAFASTVCSLYLSVRRCLYVCYDY